MNLKQYLGKKRVYTKVPIAPRVSRLWVWDEKAGEYRAPVDGKQYYGYRYENDFSGATKRVYQSFDSLDSTRKWQAGTTAVAIENSDNGDVSDAEGVVQSSEEVSNNPLFGQIVEEWKKRRFPHLAPGTQLLYQKILRLHFQSLMNLRIRDLDPRHIDLWVDELKAGSLVSKNKATRKNFRHELELLSTILRYYQNYHDDSAFQFPLKKRHREASRLSNARALPQKDLSAGEFLIFREELRKLKHGEMLAVLAAVQFYQALRISEAAGLFWEDIQFDWKNPKNSRIRVVRSVWYPHTGGLKPEVRWGFKNAASNQGIKEQPMFPESHEALMSIYEKSKTGLIFEWESKPIPYRVIQAHFDRAFQNAGFPYRGTHVMRHGGCRRIYNEHGDLSLAQQILGNSDLKTTLVYAKRQASALTQVSQEHWEKRQACETSTDCN